MTLPSTLLNSLSGTGVVYRDPLILCTVPLEHLPLGILGPLSDHSPDLRATVLLSLWWSHEVPSFRTKLVSAVRDHRNRFPNLKVTVLCNTMREADLLCAAGVTAVFCNHNIFVSETDFRPLPSVSIEFDAVYNARLNDWKRHELAAEVPRVAYICYQAPDPAQEAEASRILASLASREPAHEIINPIVGGRPQMVPYPVVNRTYNRSVVGLCLSATEGAMFASTEYLLAGLPIVSTPSIGGRDVFFSSEFCLIVPPDSRTVRQAVAWLQSQKISREYVREVTLSKIQRERSRFLALLDTIAIKAGSNVRFGPEWPFAMKPRLVRWASVREHLRDIVPQGSAD